MSKRLVVSKERSPIQKNTSKNISFRDYAVECSEKDKQEVINRVRSYIIDTFNTNFTEYWLHPAAHGTVSLYKIQK